SRTVKHVELNTACLTLMMATPKPLGTPKRTWPCWEQWRSVFWTLRARVSVKIARSPSRRRHHYALLQGVFLPGLLRDSPAALSAAQPRHIPRNKVDEL